LLQIDNPNIDVDGRLNRIITATQLLDTKYPDISYWLGELLRAKGRLSIIGEAKTAKSFFAIQLGLHIATGTPFLGMDTKQGCVLYVNFEISQEKLQERVDDLKGELDMANIGNLLIISPGALHLDRAEGKQELEGLIVEARAIHGQLDVLILDPRRYTMRGDENQSEILTAWSSNLDELRDKYNLAIVIVHHKGKNTSGAGRGSSVFDGWLDTMLWLEPGKINTLDREGSVSQFNLSYVRLPITARDTEQSEPIAEFQYPIWQLTEEQAKDEKTKGDEATKAITNIVQTKGELPLRVLRIGMIKEGHTNYAFKLGLKRLKDAGNLEERQDTSKQGNHKIVKWVSPSE
jgi:hypothetical protein